jgi:MFS transporter, DHA3 family, macrolide efflux protein
MRTFLSVWIGQFVSMLGSKLSEFALAIWAYQQTPSMTHIAFLAVLMYVPNFIASPFAGAAIDRCNRRVVMIYSDLAAGGCSLIMMLLAFSGQLQLWHIYLTIPVLSISNAFQAPAYSAAITQIVPKEHYGRANGMTEIPIAVSRILTPLITVLLMGIIQLQGILFIDTLTFIISLATLSRVKFPRLYYSTVSKQRDVQRLFIEAVESWHYIRAQPRLFRLWLFIISHYFTAGMFEISFWLLVLKFGSVTKFSIVISASECGMLLGSLFMSVSGRPRRRVIGILKLTALQGFVIIILGIGVKISLFVASFGAFIYLFAAPIIMGAYRTIWQHQIPQELQGRVFSVLLMVQRGAMVPAYIITGLMINQIFEPMIATNTFVQNFFGKHLSHEPGIAICLFLVLLGIIKLLLSIFAAQDSLLVNVENL